VTDFGFSALVTLSLILLCLVSWFAYRASPDDRRATFLWFLGSLSLAAASGFYAIRPELPSLVGVNVFFVNFFLCLGVGLHVMGLVRLDDRDQYWWVFWIPGAAASVLGAWVLGFPWGDEVQPILVAFGLLVWISRAVYWVASRRWGERDPVMRRVLGFYLFAAVVAVIFGSRVYWIPALPFNAAQQFSIGLTAAVLFLLDLSLLGIGFAELLLIHDLSLRRYRQESESKLKAMVDLEEYRKLQKTLVERERDVSLARMVATVNHSLNSPLAALISANAMLGQVVRDQLPALVFSLRTLAPHDWWLVSRIAQSMRPMTTDKRRKRRAALIEWLRQQALPEEPDSLVDVGIDLRPDLLDELTRTSNPAAVFRLLNVWADSLTARNVVDQSARKTAKLLQSLREWFETGFHTGSGSSPVSEVLRSQVTAVRRAHPGVTIDVALEAAAAVDIPVRPLERVFGAVLENAVHAAGTTGSVSVRAFDTAGGVTVEVTDDGPGVSASKQQFLFEPFVGASVDSQSLGVSLYFSRLFLTEWGGSIAYFREKSATRFIIELPQS
jgi:signal transduction histidine kinase